jgi:hypothetical protein
MNTDFHGVKSGQDFDQITPLQVVARVSDSSAEKGTNVINEGART